jgi:hypothetical protein
VQTQGLGPRSGPDFLTPADPRLQRREPASPTHTTRVSNAADPRVRPKSSSIPRLLAAGLLVVGVSAGAGAIAGRYADDPAGSRSPR